MRTGLRQAVRLSLMLLMASLGFDASSQQTPPDAERPRGSYILSLPPPLSREEIARYAQILHLAAPQRLLLERTYEDEYRPARLRLEATLMPDLKALSERSAMMTASGLSPDSVALFEEFKRAEHEVVQRLVKPESLLFESLATYLSDVQLQSLPRVMSHRARRRCACKNREIPGARIDLVERIEGAGFETQMLESLDSTLAEYESKVTAPFVDLESEVQRTAIERQKIILHRLRSPHGQPVQPGTLEDAQHRDAAVEALKRLSVKGAVLEQQIADLNAEYLPKFLEALPDAAAAELKARYLREAYPATYPDPARPSEHPASLLQRLGADQNIVIAATEIWDRYETAYLEICEKMMRLEDAWHIKIVETRNGLGRPEHLQAMDALRARRNSLTERTLRQIISIAPPELADGVRGWSGLHAAR